MANQIVLGGSSTLTGTSMSVGYGAMQLVVRRYRDCLAVLQGLLWRGQPYRYQRLLCPHLTNQIIRRALHPYPEGLVIVTK
jgi:pyridoxine 4-dehydrogenase